MPVRVRQTLGVPCELHISRAGSQLLALLAARDGILDGERRDDGPAVGAGVVDVVDGLAAVGGVDDVGRVAGGVGGGLGFDDGYCLGDCIGAS